MRKLLLTMAVLAGAAAAAGAHSTAAARPGLTAVAPVIVLDQPAAQPVQYYEDRRYHEWRRREAFERFRRHQEWRRWHRFHDGYGRW